MPVPFNYINSALIIPITRDTQYIIHKTKSKGVMSTDNEHGTSLKTQHSFSYPT